MINRWSWIITYEWSEKGPADSWLNLRQFTGERRSCSIEIPDVLLYAVTLVIWVSFVARLR